MRECCKCTILNKTDCVFGATKIEEIRVRRNTRGNTTGTIVFDCVTVFKCPIDNLPSKAITHTISEYLAPPFYPELQAAYEDLF